CWLHLLCFVGLQPPPTNQTGFGSTKSDQSKQTVLGGSRPKLGVPAGFLVRMDKLEQGGKHSKSTNCMLVVGGGGGGVQRKPSEPKTEEVSVNDITWPPHHAMLTDASAANDQTFSGQFPKQQQQQPIRGTTVVVNDEGRRLPART